MAEAVAAVAVTLDTIFATTAATVGNTLVAVGVPTATAAAVATVVYNVAPTVALAAATTAVGFALTPPLPSPESVKRNFKQPIPPRLSGYGWYRLGGPYMLREAKKRAHYVIAFHDGEVEAYHRYWLNDDEVSVVGNIVQKTAEGSYGAGRVKIYTRKGLPTETSFVLDDSEFSELGADVWTIDHRGDGIAGGYLKLQAVEREDFSNTYPAGAEIALSVEAQLQKVFDWRDPAQDLDDRSTWKWSDNVIVCLAHYKCLAEGGEGLPWEDTIVPFLEMWTEAANVCDEAVPLKAGGTEKRYRIGLVHEWGNAPADVTAAFLEACDGRIEEIDGGLKVWAGKYYPPTVWIEQAHILSMNVDRFREDEEAINELQLSFTSPAHAYTPVDIAPWRNDADIVARGGRVRSEPFAPKGVLYNGQCRRLGKRKMSRLAANLRGVMVTDYFGMQALGEAVLGIRFPKIPVTAEIIVDVDPDGRITIDLDAKTVTIPWVLADPNRDAWNPETEEGEGPNAGPPVIGEDVPKPIIISVTPFFASTGTGGEGVRLRVIIEAPEDPSLSYAMRWREVGAVSWATSTYTSVTPVAGEAVLDSDGFVPADKALEVQVAFRNGSGSLSEWSDSEEVSTSTSTIAPGSPTELSVGPGDPGEAAISWRNPASANLDHLKVYRGTTNIFGSAVQVGSDIVGGLGVPMVVEDAPGPGTFFYWVRAFNASAVGSAPSGPASITL